jgi:hypothetical protein
MPDGRWPSGAWTAEAVVAVGMADAGAGGCRLQPPAATVARRRRAQGGNM